MADATGCETSGETPPGVIPPARVPNPQFDPEVVVRTDDVWFSNGVDTVVQTHPWRCGQQSGYRLIGVYLLYNAMKLRNGTLPEHSGPHETADIDEQLVDHPDSEDVARLIETGWLHRIHG